MSIGQYCRRDPCTAGREDSLADAAVQMDRNGVGSLVVTDERSRPVGIVTDRELALRVIRERLDPAATRVEELMHPPVVVSESAPLAVAIRFMSQHGVRRIPVVDGETGVLTGIVAVDDVLQLLAGELGAAAEVARSQFPVRAAGEGGS